MPLHHTQKELQCNEQQDFGDFELNLRPTTDFKGQLLSRGVWLKVLEPQWLADEIRQWHEDAAGMYQT
ncbi:MAG: WYL domain-containing protein [Bacteroidales bacterium]|nr:WYL domain-containing protein [Bacteroidales bacterium]